MFEPIPLSSFRHSQSYPPSFPRRRESTNIGRVGETSNLEKTLRWFDYAHHKSAQGGGVSLSFPTSLRFFSRFAPSRMTAGAQPMSRKMVVEPTERRIRD